MPDRCTYFQSDAWDQRLNRYVATTWNLETFLRESPNQTYDRGLINELASELDTDPQTVATHSIGAVLEESPAALSATINDVRRAWKTQQDDLPDQCPHPTRDENASVCLCHLSPATRRERNLTSTDVREWLLETIEGEERGNCFVGARFGILDLANARITAPDNRPIDFRYADIAGSVECANTLFSQDVRFKGADLGPRELEQGTDEMPAFGDHFVDFVGDIDFMDARFERTADFKFVTFRGETRFNSTTFDGPALFNYAQFTERTDFMAASCNGKTDFSKSHFEDAAFLNGTYNGAVIFNYATFDDQVDLWSTTFHRKAEFWATTIRGQLNAQYADFQGTARFTEVTFEGPVTFQHATFDGEVYFKRVSATSDIDLERATLSNGEIALPDTDPPCYDIRHATIGELSLEAPAERYNDLFEYFYIERTVFDGFEFADYGAALQPDWRLHTNDLSTTKRSETIDSSTLEGLADLEATYLKAKTGANDVGHNKAASEFFFHEMRARRKHHAARIIEAESIRGHIGALVKWTSNALLGVTSGYGERPRRVVGSSLTTIGLFAVLYWGITVSSGGSDTTSIDYLLLSFQSFITFILGDTPQQPIFALELVTAIQGFVGAFLIALLVFTLTRSIHR